MRELKYKKILVTYDGSKLASQAFPHALYLAHNLHVKILLLWVSISVGKELILMNPADMAPATPIMGETAEQIVQENRKEAERQLLKLKSDLEESGAGDVATHVVEGEAGEEIVRFAKKNKCDLIVMATHGRSGLGRAFLGSVADYAVRHASCPILLVHSSNTV